MPERERYAQLCDDLSIVDLHHLCDLEGDVTFPLMTSGEHVYQDDNPAFRRTCLSQEYRRDTVRPASGF